MYDAEDVTNRTVELLLPSQCTYDHFRQRHLLPNTPALLPASLIQDWPVCYWREGAATLEAPSAPLSPFRDLRLDETGACLVGAEDDTSYATLGDLLNAWEQELAREVYLKDWHLPLWLAKRGNGEDSISEELYEVPAVCRDDWMNSYYGAETEDDFRFLYAGGGDTFTPLHRDVYCSYSISSNLLGAKLWHLFPLSCTSALLPLIAAAEREGSSVDVRKWSSELLTSFEAMGLRIVRQEEGETIFIPSGWFHQVTNLSHPTISLNHNWCNSHNISAMYDSMCAEVARCREAILDVREMLEAKGDVEGESWLVEWESCVAELVRQSAGWNWSTFWRMIRHALRGVSSTLPLPSPRWPVVSSSCRPSPGYVAEQVRPLLLAFKGRPEKEWILTSDLGAVLDEVEALSERLGRE